MVLEFDPIRPSVLNPKIKFSDDELFERSILAINKYLRYYCDPGICATKIPFSVLPYRAEKCLERIRNLFSKAGWLTWVEYDTIVFLPSDFT